MKKRAAVIAYLPGPMADRAYRRYLLGLLLLILAFNYVDRAVLGIVLQDIKDDLSLTDSQLGLLTGFAFALFYSVIGIPIARWADRGNRRTIIALTTTAWSAMVVLCGLAGNFSQLLLARIGVAVGEAGCVPPASSLIPDHFTREERPRAMSIYYLGSPLSIIIGYFLGGWLNEIVGWRMTFILLGVPGVLLGLIAWMTLREPRLSGGGTRQANNEAAQRSLIEPIPIIEVSRYLWRSRSYRNLVLGFSIIGFFGAGIGVWLPSFFIRSHGMETAELGMWMALGWGALGAAGLYLGGVLAARFAAGREGRQFRWIATVIGLFSVVSVGTYLASDKYIALMLMGLGAFTLSGVTAPVFGAIPNLTPPHMRAQGMAIIFFMYSLIGLGLGPVVAGLVSDALAPSFGADSLRYTLVLLSPGYLWAAFHFGRASRTMEEDIAAASHFDEKVCAPDASVLSQDLDTISSAPEFLDFNKAEAYDQP